MSGCDPVLSGEQRAVVEGVVLAGAHVSDRGGLIIQTVRRDLAEWTVDALGWLAGSLTRVTDDNPMHQPMYRLETPTHWQLERYEDWTGGRGPPVEYELSSRAGRVWWAHGGHLEFADDGAYRIGRISAEADPKAVWVVRLLGDVGVDADRWHNYVQLTSDDLDNWLAWIGDPVPGVEHKWATSREEYERLRSP
ncbi:hypothetical protein [Halocalculus aciditolerans]|nr:hypothetical protein [Halocalculus aciditolerans]